MKALKSLFEKTRYALGGALLTMAVYADEGSESTLDLLPKGSFEGLSKITIPSMVPVIIRVVLIAAALVALLFLIIGGIRWITSGGDKTAVEAARGTITSALIGLLIVFAAWAIVRLIELFFGIKILSELEIPSIPEVEYVPK